MHLPILALTPHERSMRRMALYRGVETMLLDATSIDAPELEEKLLAEVRTRGALSSGDLVILTRGAHPGVNGGTDSMRILHVP